MTLHPRLRRKDDPAYLAEKRENTPMADLSPIMTLFKQWDVLRDLSNEPGISEDEVDRRCDETDNVMVQLLALPVISAQDLAAKVMCFTHYGSYDLKDFNGGIELMQEMAAMVGGRIDA